ncbi:hypothetical protein CBW53_02890 [Yersinia frederiksenii]|nr:hypothetical protein CBW53_02890 [Yersinia frederiksenii]
MKRIIKNDSLPVHILAAHAAIDMHEKKHSNGNKHNYVFYNITYKNKSYQIEVITTHVSFIANVINGARNLTRICESI